MTYDPKAKRAHSPTAASEPPPVDRLLASPSPEASSLDASSPDAAPAEVGPDPAPPPAPVGQAVRTGPDPRVVALVAAAAVVGIVLWRRRR